MVTKHNEGYDMSLSTKKKKNRKAAAAGMVLAAILGGLTVFALLGTICSNRRKRAKAWMTLTG